MVGRWTQTAGDELDTTIFPGTTLHISGGSGFVLTLTAAGTETDDWSNAAPYSSSGGGHTYSNVQRGMLQYGFHAMAGHWVETGGSGQTTSREVFDGAPRADYIAHAGPPTSGTYSCSSSTLTWVQTAPAALNLTFTR